MKQPCGCCEGVERITPTEIFNRPGLPALLYRMGTHSTLLETMQADLAAWPISVQGNDPAKAPVTTYPLSALTTRDPSDPSIALLDAWAVVGDVLTFYQERIANEGFLRTALHRCSVLELARLIGYRLRPGVAASVFLAFTLEQGADKNAELPVPQGTRANSIPGPGETPQAFETSADLVARPAWSALKPRLTRPQKITADANDDSFGAPNIESIFFDGTSTKLKAGDALLIVCDDSSGNQFLRFVDSVNPDDKNKRTEVTLQPPPPSFTGSASQVMNQLLRRYLQEAADLFPGSKVIAAVVDTLSGVQDALKQPDPLSQNEIVEQARLALPDLQAQLQVAQKRKFTRMTPWISELISDWQNFIASPGGPSQGFNTESAVAGPSGSIKFGDVAAPRLPGFLALSSVIQKLALPPSAPPPSPASLSRNLSVAFSQAADNLPQLLTGLRSELSGSLYNAWKNLELPPNPVKVYALRTRARLYGHNAPPRIAATNGEGVVTAWGEWQVFSSELPVDSNGATLPGVTFPNHESAQSVYLDSSYQSIVAGSWLVLATPELGTIDVDFLTRGPRTQSASTPNLQFARVSSIQPEVSRADYGMSSKSSLINLGQPGDSANAYSWLSAATPSTKVGANFWAIRQTAVFAQSEELTLADAPIEDDISGGAIELDDLYDGLKPGRWMIVTGNRSDVPGTTGVAASELVMLAGVTQGGQSAQCVNFPSQLVPFASIFYVTDPNSQGDRLVVGAPAADLQTLLQQLPLPDPDSPNQVYCAPVELAPGFYGQAYVPTKGDDDAEGQPSGERNGNFSAFVGLLIDPESGAAFPGGIIPATRQDVFAWRIVSTRDSVHTTIQLASPLSYAYDPPTVTIYGNVAKATHGQTQSEILGSGDASQTLQTFALSKPPLTYVSAPTPDGTDSTLVVRVNGIGWHEQESLADMSAGSRTFFTEEDHSGVTSVTFGDGVHGSRVPTAPSNVKAVYRSGIGSPGNIDAQKISQLATRPLGVSGVINPLPSTGGADADTLEQARSNIPIAVMALDRLVSLADYAFFTRNYAGVAKASASALSYGSSRMVQVTFAAVGDAPVDASSDFFTNLSDALVKFGDPLAPVQLARRSALLLVIKAEVRVLPDYLWDNVAPLVRAAMLHKFGFDNRQLQQDAILSEVFAATQSVEGVDYVKVDAFGAISDIDSFGQPLDPDALTKALKNLIQNADPANLPSRIVANSSRVGSAGILPAQIAYLSAAVADCLLLSELKP